MKIIAVDPGKTTGWAEFLNGKPVRVGEAKIEDVWDWLKDLQPDIFVVEDYKIRPASVTGGYAHQWSNGIALQVIGAIKYHAHVEHSKIVLQQPAIKPMGYALMNGKYVKGKGGMHMQDALAHGFYFLEHHAKAK